MSHVVKTPRNWAKDEILTEQIFEALETTETKDFIYTCSVQGHGVYPTEQVLENPEIEVTKAPSEKQKWQYEYYVNQIYEMDTFIGELTAALEDYDEDTVVVIYGDHLPALDMTEDEMMSGNLFNTQYVIWSNFPMKVEKKDLYSYQVAAEVFDRIGYHMGVMTKYHQKNMDTEQWNTEEYRAGMKLLEYDMLYGKNLIFGGKSPDDFDEETLTTINKFFENSLNVSETSRQLFIHRNTLVYRLDKLQKSTGLDLRVFEDAITFKIALMVVKYGIL